jgi:hypothetical protein
LLRVWKARHPTLSANSKCDQFRIQSRSSKQAIAKRNNIGTQKSSSPTDSLSEPFISDSPVFVALRRQKASVAFGKYHRPLSEEVDSILLRMGIEPYPSKLSNIPSGSSVKTVLPHPSVVASCLHNHEYEPTIVFNKPNKMQKDSKKISSNNQSYCHIVGDEIEVIRLESKNTSPDSNSDDGGCQSADLQMKTKSAAPGWVQRGIDRQKSSDSTDKISFGIMPLPHDPKTSQEQNPDKTQTNDDIQWGLFSSSEAALLLAKGKTLRQMLSSNIINNNIKSMNINDKKSK